MCNRAMAPCGAFLPVYNKKLCVQQILRKPERSAHPHGCVHDKRSRSRVPELRPAVVAGGNDPNDFAAFSLLQQMLEVFDDMAIWLPSLQGDDFCPGRLLWVRRLQLGSPSLVC